MAEAIKNIFVKITENLQFDRGLFDVSAHDVHYTDSRYFFATPEDAWRHDWQNIAGDFRRACGNFEREIAGWRNRPRPSSPHLGQVRCPMPYLRFTPEIAASRYARGNVYLQLGRIVTDEAYERQRQHACL